MTISPPSSASPLVIEIGQSLLLHPEMWTFNKYNAVIGQKMRDNYLKLDWMHNFPILNDMCIQEPHYIYLNWSERQYLRKCMKVAKKYHVIGQMQKLMNSHNQKSE